MKGIQKKALFATVLFFLCSIAFLPMTAASAETTLYYIQRGDTLIKIARRHNTTVDHLMSLNAIVNPDQITAGVALIVPVASGTGTVTAPDQYIVMPGDTLGKIARRFGATVTGLAALNGIDNPNRISIGQTLRIEPGQATAPAAPENHYYVVKGDVLRRIARRFGVSLETLMQLNGIEDPNLIYEGQLLQLK